MSAKNLDQKGRHRNKVVAFRVSAEEDALIEKEVHLSGLTKQDFIIKRLQNKEIVVQGNFMSLLLYRKLTFQSTNHY